MEVKKPRLLTCWSRTRWPITLGQTATLLLMLGASRLFGITHQSFWYDEGYTATLASTKTFHDFWRQFGAFTMSEHLQPLYYLFIFVWSRLFGTSDVALRLPSALFSIGSGIAASGAVSLLTRKPRYLVFSCLVITISSYSLYYGQDARPYALLQMLSFTLLFAWLYLRRAPGSSASPVQQIAFGAACGLCLLGSPFTALLVLCVALADLLVYRPLAAWIRLWGPAFAIGASFYLAYLIPALRYMPALLAHDVISLKQPLWMNVGYTIYGMVYGTTLPPASSLLREPHKLQAVLSAWPTLVPALLSLCLLTWAAFEQVYRASRVEARIRVLLLSLFTYFLVLFAFFGAVGHLNVLPRHASALFALLFLTVASCATHSLESGRTNLRMAFAAGLFGILLLNGFSIYEYRNNPLFAKDDYRDTAAYLRQQKTASFLVSGQPVLLARYGASTVDATSAVPHSLATFIHQRAGNNAHVALVYNDYRNYRWDFTDMDVIQAMSSLYSCRNEKQFPDIEVYSCTAAGAVGQ